MPDGVAAILVVLGGFAVYVLAWVAVLCVRGVRDRRALRRAEYALIAQDVAEINARPATPQTAAVPGATPPPVVRRHVEWAPPVPPRAGRRPLHFHATAREDSVMTGMPPAAAGYVWRYVLGQEQSHQFPTPVAPDAEGVLVTMCGDLVMAFRVLDEYRLPACFSCRIAHGTREADRLEGWAARMAASNRVTS